MTVVEVERRATPGLQGLLDAADAMGVDPGRCLVVEYCVQGVRAARAGVTPFGYAGVSHLAPGHGPQLAA